MLNAKLRALVKYAKTMEKCTYEGISLKQSFPYSVSIYMCLENETSQLNTEEGYLHKNQNDTIVYIVTKLQNDKIIRFK